MSTCRASGCCRPTTARGHYCNTHKSRKRMNGAPDQRTIRKHELHPYRVAVRRRIRRNPSSEAWSTTRGRWEIVVDGCRRIINDTATPRARFERQAAEAVVKVANEVDAAVVMEVALAMYLMRDQDPRFFQTEEAFRFQLGRMVRAQTSTAAATYFHHETGKMRSVYRVLPPRAMRCLGELLNTVFGLPGHYVARKAREEAERRDQQRAGYFAALEALR